MTNVNKDVIGDTSVKNDCIVFDDTEVEGVEGTLREITQQRISMGRNHLHIESLRNVKLHGSTRKLFAQL